MAMTFHPTDIHFCGIRIWFEHEGVAPHLSEDLRMARESLAHMAENAGMMLPGLKTPRVKGYQDRIAALEHDLARANREWHAWQERAKTAEAFAKEAQSPPLLAELVNILGEVVGDHGASEGAADCARRIIKERNQWKSAAQKMVERKIFTAADAINAGLQSEIAKLQDQAARDAVQYKINLDRLRAERDEARQMHRERVFWEKSALNEQIAHLGENLTKLRVAVERMLEPCLGEAMRQERMAELRKAMA